MLMDSCSQTQTIGIPERMSYVLHLLRNDVCRHTAAALVCACSNSSGVQIGICIIEQYAEIAFFFAVSVAGVSE